MFTRAFMAWVFIPGEIDHAIDIHYSY